jgi:hypothetical protein
MQSENRHHDDDLDLLWGAKAIATFLRTTERKVWYYVECGYLPVKRQGRLITASRSELRKQFAAPTSAPKPASAAPADAASSN